MLVLLVSVIVTACGGSGGHADWRGVEFDLPEGWVVFEETPFLLGVANGPLGEEEGDPGRRVVAAQFQFDRAASSASVWRDFVEQEGATLEEDEDLTLDGVPATRLVYSFTTNGIPTREMIVVIPARELYILMQPVPVAGQQDAPEIFLEHRDDFETILSSIDFGAPVDV